MRYLKKTGLAAALLGMCLLAGRAGAVEIIDNENMKLNIGGRAQLFGMLEWVEGETGDRARTLVFVRDTRLRFDGDFEGGRFGIEFGLGGEAATQVNDPDVSALLLDAWGDIRLRDNLILRAGQFKIPYSRERLADGGSLQFTSRSINTRAFNIGRDTGVAVYGNDAGRSAALGFFTGGGVNQRIRNIPVNMGTPMVVLRAGLNDLDEDIFTVEEFYREREGTALHFNALYLKNTAVGGNSVIGLRRHDSSFMLDSNWNPFLAAEQGEELMMAGVDFAAQRRRYDGSMLSFGAEINHGRYNGEDEDGASGRFSLTAGTVRAGISWQSFQLALRYSMLVPDDSFPDDEGNIHVVAPGINFFISENIKLQFDLPVMFNAPTAPGEYNRVYQGGSLEDIERRTAVSGRMILQFKF